MGKDVAYVIIIENTKLVSVSPVFAATILLETFAATFAKS
jgi:hypothetical protein